MGGEDALPCKSFVTSFEILVNFIWFDWSGGGEEKADLCFPLSPVFELVFIKTDTIRLPARTNIRPTE